MFQNENKIKKESMLPLERFNQSYRLYRSGNFYRYMSLPYQVLIPFHKNDIKEKLKIFSQMIKETHQFLEKTVYSNPLHVSYFYYDQYAKHNKNNKEYNSLPWYIQSLCTYHTLCNYIKNKSKLELVC